MAQSKEAPAVTYVVLKPIQGSGFSPANQTSSPSRACLLGRITYREVHRIATALHCECRIPHRLPPPYLLKVRCVAHSQRNWLIRACSLSFAVFCCEAHSVANTFPRSTLLTIDNKDRFRTDLNSRPRLKRPVHRHIFTLFSI